MSQADVERFVADLKKDPELLKQVQAGSTGLANVVSLAKSKGYDVSMDEAKAYIAQQAKKELSDEQLDAVAGGKGPGGFPGGPPVVAIIQAAEMVGVVVTAAGVAPPAAVVTEVVAAVAIS